MSKIEANQTEKSRYLFVSSTPVLERCDVMVAVRHGSIFWCEFRQQESEHNSGQRDFLFFFIFFCSFYIYTSFTVMYHWVVKRLCFKDNTVWHKDFGIVILCIWNIWIQIQLDWITKQLLFHCFRFYVFLLSE